MKFEETVRNKQITALSICTDRWPADGMPSRDVYADVGMGFWVGCEALLHPHR